MMETHCFPQPPMMTEVWTEGDSESKWTSQREWSLYNEMGYMQCFDRLV